MSSTKQVCEPENESFIATATAVESPYETEARPYLQVVAPANLPEVRMLYGNDTSCLRETLVTTRVA